MNESKCAKTRQIKAITIILFMDVLALFVLEMHPLLIVGILVWSVTWLTLNLTWIFLWDENEIKEGYKIPFGSFILRRRLLFSGVGRVFSNGIGSVIFLKKTEMKFPGKKEIVIPHNLKEFEMVLGEVLEKVHPSCVDENVKLLIQK